MKFISKNKGLIVFYLVIAVFTYLLALRVESLDKKEYIDNNKAVVINLWQ
jgi:hypothetical protein